MLLTALGDVSLFPIFSGLIPNQTSLPTLSFTFSALLIGSSNLISSPTSTKIRLSFSTRTPLVRFIAGEPMKPATNLLAGLLYRFKGVSTCIILPKFRTQILSPIVIAST